MTPERWKRVENLYQEALARDPADRSPFLLAACGADAELKREVKSAACLRRRGFMEPPERNRHAWVDNSRLSITFRYLASQSM